MLGFNRKIRIPTKEFFIKSLLSSQRQERCLDISTKLRMVDKMTTFRVHMEDNKHIASKLQFCFTKIFLWTLIIITLRIDQLWRQDLHEAKVIVIDISHIAQCSVTVCELLLTRGHSWLWVHTHLVFVVCTSPLCV
ncbi:hypothetical protein VNO77_23189 [Canavalia gladiata]|uniref:Uncharacterized protein n=1 Tax=Canavalia gladiata TaxID=3824 RepID=A0AAN9QBN6_CANGL